MFYMIKYIWIATKGYRLRPWRSPYLCWRIETYFGVPAEAVDFKTFWRLLYQKRREVWRFLRWAEEMARTARKN